MGEEKGCRMMVMKRGKKCKEGREEKWKDPEEGWSKERKAEETRGTD